MPYRICKILEIESGHMLSKHADNCRFPHGHSRRVELVLEADELDQNDMVCDFKVIKKALQPLLDRYDHAMCLNTDDPNYDQFVETWGDRTVSFEHADPTCEVIARHLFDNTQAALNDYLSGSNVHLIKVRIWETSTSWAEYRADGAHPT